MSLKNAGLSQHNLVRDLEFVCQLQFDFFPLKSRHVIFCCKVSDGFASLSVTSQTITISYQVGPELAVAAFPPLTFPNSSPATLKQALAFSLYIAVLSFHAKSLASTSFCQKQICLSFAVMICSFSPSCR